MDFEGALVSLAKALITPVARARNYPPPQDSLPQ